MVQPVQTAFQQQIQALQAQHQELVASLRQSPAPAQPQPQPSPVPAAVVQPPAGEREAPAPTTQHGTGIGPLLSTSAGLLRELFNLVHGFCVNEADGAPCICRG